MSTSPAGWTDHTTIDLSGLRVTLSEPRLVGRSRGYFWFPNLWHMPSGDLLATIWALPDIHMASSPYFVTWSRDGGLTWSEPLLTNDGGQALLHLANGDAILLPYDMRPRPNGIGASYNLIPAGKREVKFIASGLTVTGFPGTVKYPIVGLDMAGMSFNGQTLQLSDGRYLATVYGQLEEQSGYRIFTVVSDDGVHWTVDTLIADNTCGVTGKEGPNEVSVTRIKDGRLMCIFRVGSVSNYGQCWSSDEGKTWSQPITMDGVFSVQPSVAMMADGALALSGGRPGIHLWLNADGSGANWQAIDLQTHHNTCHPNEYIKAYNQHDHFQQTSAYTEVVAVDDTHLLVIYDRVPNGWQAVPEDMDDTNSVWLVRITIEKSHA